MKRTNTIIILFLICAVIICSLTGCGERYDVKKLITSLEKACDSLDVDGILDCLNPRTVDPLRTTLALLGVSDLNSVLEELGNLLDLEEFEGLDSADVIRSLKFEPFDFQFNSDKTDCEVYTKVYYTVNGQELETDVLLYCSEIRDHWYIMDIH